MEVQFSYTNSLALINMWQKSTREAAATLSALSGSLGGRASSSPAAARRATISWWRSKNFRRKGDRGEILRAPGDDFVVALEEFSHGLPFGVVREAGEGEAIGGVNLPVRIAAGGLDDAAGEAFGPLQGQV